MHSQPVEIAGKLPLWQRWLARRQPHALRSLVELRALAESIAGDPQIEGLLVHVPRLNAGWATCTSLRETLTSLRARGKRVAVYLPLGGGNRELYVALAAERVLVAPQAPLSLLGLSSEVVYFKPLLDRAGVQVEVQASGAYKTAAEPYAREAMSEPQKEQLSALLATLQQALEQALAARMDAERVRLLFERGLWGVQPALQAGVIDSACHEDELPTVLGLAPEQPAFVSHRQYLTWHRGRLWHRVRARPEIAVVSVQGTIAHAAPALPVARVATHTQLAATLRSARKNKRVHAVLLLIDSPGGSALASDLIHREIVRLREKKPVVAFLGNVAASGGYYVAAPCQRIVAQPTTVTGSIGVVSARLLGGVLAERLGLRPQVLRAAPHADMLSLFRAADPDEQAMLAAEVEHLYKGFVDIVAQGRQRPAAEIEAIARGRVWSGIDALRCGLVDELGGFDRAVAALKALTPSLRDLPEGNVLLRVASKTDDEPPPEPAQAKLWTEAGSELSALARLVHAGEHALFYATVPEIR